MAGPFELNIARFVEKAKGNADLVVRKVALDVFSRVIEKSPVGNPDLWKHPAPPGYTGGRFKSNWLVAIGSIPEGTTVAIDVSAAITRVEAETLGAKAGDVIYLVNNLPYARALEYGHSTQAPVGMVRLTVQEFGAIVDAAASEVPK